MPARFTLWPSLLLPWRRLLSECRKRFRSEPYGSLFAEAFTTFLGGLSHRGEQMMAAESNLALEPVGWINMLPLRALWKPLRGAHVYPSWGNNLDYDCRISRNMSHAEFRSYI